MLATSFIDVSDISKTRNLRMPLEGGRLSPRHTVRHAVDSFLDEMAIPADHDRWTVISRGKRLDQKALLGDVPEELTSWTVVPEVSAGGR